MNRFLKVCMIKYDYEQINKSEFAEGLVMIHYDIDTTENGYKKFEGKHRKKGCMYVYKLDRTGNRVQSM